MKLSKILVNNNYSHFVQYYNYIILVVILRLFGMATDWTRYIAKENNLTENCSRILL